MPYIVAGQVDLKPTTPWPDGAANLLMPPLEFMQRLAPLVPRPRLGPIPFQDWLVSNAGLAAQTVLGVCKAEDQSPEVAAASVVSLGSFPSGVEMLRRLRFIAGRSGSTLCVHDLRTQSLGRDLLPVDAGPLRMTADAIANIFRGVSEGRVQRWTGRSLRKPPPTGVGRTQPVTR